MAKLGQLVLDKGKAANGKRVISAAQLAALFERSATNPAYGRLWWLNGSTYTLRPAGVRTEKCVDSLPHRPSLSRPSARRTGRSMSCGAVS